MYLTLGLVFYSSHEEISPFNAAYFSVVTLSTVGYGDISTQYHHTKIFSSVYALLSSTLIASIIFVFITLLLDELDIKSRLRRQRSAAQIKEAIGTSNDSKTNNVTVRSEALAHHTVEVVASVTMAEMDKELIQAVKTLRNAVLLLMSIIFIGAAIISVIENWYFLTAFYWTCVTISTIGNGDVVPITSDGKLFAIFFILVGFSSVAFCLYHLIQIPFLLHDRRFVVYYCFYWYIANIVFLNI